jgi:hypothetical protein
MLPIGKLLGSEQLEKQVELILQRLQEHKPISLNEIQLQFKSELSVIGTIFK